MSETDTGYPTFPPGFWRRIVLQPGPGWIGGALEDDMHNFRIRLDHDGERIRAVHARAVRVPWTGCPGAAPHIEAELTGEQLAEVAARDPAQQCTHLFDLAILCAAHAADTQPTIFDMRVADRTGGETPGAGRTTAALNRDGVEQVRWHLDATMIDGPEPFAGRDIKRLSQWKHDYSPETAEYVTLLRRAVFVSGARQYEPPVGKTAADMGSLRAGVCFNYQSPQIETSTPEFDRREFSMSGREPLEGLDAAAEFAEMVRV